MALAPVRVCSAGTDIGLRAGRWCGSRWGRSCGHLLSLIPGTYALVDAVSVPRIDDDAVAVGADVGRVVNRDIVDGQLYGGMIQGLGLALSEDFEDIQKQTTLAACGIPYIKDAPDNMELLYIESDREDGPFGAAGCGEAPLTAPHPAIINAIYNACGARVTKLPAYPEKVLEALKVKRGGCCCCGGD